MPHSRYGIYSYLWVRPSYSVSAIEKKEQESSSDDGGRTLGFSHSYMNLCLKFRFSQKATKTWPHLPLSFYVTQYFFGLLRIYELSKIFLGTLKMFQVTEPFNFRIWYTPSSNRLACLKFTGGEYKTESLREQVWQATSALKTFVPFQSHFDKRNQSKSFESMEIIDKQNKGKNRELQDFLQF